MTTRANDPDFYIDWACRITEEVCLRSNRRLSQDGITAFKNMYTESAKAIADRPAIFRAGSADMQFWLAEAAQLMVKSAEYSGASAIEPDHVRAAAGALEQMRTVQGRVATPWCPKVGQPPT